MDKISIVIPAWNEEKRISKTLEAYLEYFDNLKNNNILDYELLIVINNTQDDTEKIVKNYQKRYFHLGFSLGKQMNENFIFTFILY